MQYKLQWHFQALIVYFQAQFVKHEKYAHPPHGLIGYWYFQEKIALIQPDSFYLITDSHLIM